MIFFVTLEQLRRADQAIHEALTLKQRLVGQILGIPEEHYTVIADMAPLSKFQEVGEVLLTAIQHSQQLAQLLGDSIVVTEEEEILTKFRYNNSCDICDQCNIMKNEKENLNDKQINKVIEDSSKEPEINELHDITEVKEADNKIIDSSCQPLVDYRNCHLIPSVPANELSKLVSAVIPTLTYLLVNILNYNFNLQLYTN